MFSPYNFYKQLLYHPKFRWVVIFLTIIYLFSPVDILPEIVLNVFGLIDDGFLLSLLISTLLTIKQETKINQTNNSKHDYTEFTKGLD